ncbi:MAG: ABC transporter ATP-binding protein [Elusimicrobia bacterium]|nr:ABC transporter ATP-binding protein [Elusimicrobiota bacterium]
MDSSSRPALEAKGVHKSYRKLHERVDVLKGADLSVRAGEFVAVTGPSGSGKSTMLHLLGMMDEPDEGEILLFGSPVKDMPELERARLRNSKLGFAFQFDSLLPDFTVLENVTMPARIGGSAADAEARARELLGRFGLGALTDRFPQELSGGERQRVAMARALVNRPALLLADEPTGNLDRRNGELVFYALKEVADSIGVAVVLVTHNDYAAQFATRILRLSEGRVTEVEAIEPSKGSLKP